jgi:hypothetical protein
MRSSMNTYGYTHISRQFVEDFSVDFEAIAKVLNWTFEVGTLCISFRNGKAPSVLAFGHRPEKKELRRMIKESKQ